MGSPTTTRRAMNRLRRLGDAPSPFERRSGRDTDPGKRRCQRTESALHPDECEKIVDSLWSIVDSPDSLAARSARSSRSVLAIDSMTWRTRMSDATLRKQQAILENQTAIMKNQSAILANQKQIIGGVKSVLANQKRILANQARI